MHVISVIPLKRGINSTTLTYFSKVAYPSGTIVQVPVRKKTVPALVTESTTASANKTSLKAASFSLRKLPTQDTPTTVAPALLRTATALQRYYPTTIGNLLYTLLPNDVRQGDVEQISTTDTIHEEDTTPQTLQAITKDRYITYQSHIRTIFARSGSVLLVVPSSAHIITAKARLVTGISERVVTLSSEHTKTQRRQAFAKIQENTAPLLIITTPSYAYIDRPDIRSIILEQSAHAQYQERIRPYLDHRLALQILAKTTGRNLLFGDTVVRSEDEHARREDRFLSYDESPKRLVFPARLRIIEHPTGPDKDTTFQLFTDETIRRLQTILNRRENVFLYAARRGLAPVVTCFDCGNILRCPDSGSPYSLHRRYNDAGEEERWFIDSTSGKRVRAADTCDQCGSWRLRERGIGIQQIADILPDFFPEIPVILFDSSTATSTKRTRELTEQMKKSKGAIILGTAVALPYLPEHITTSCVTSYEAASSIPSWRADEIFFRLLLELREKSQHEVILQTRTEPSPIIAHADRGALEKFYDEELELRNMLRYPPFSTLVLCTWEGTRDAVQELETSITDLLTAYQPHCYNHPLSHATKVRRHALLRIPQSDWPSEDLFKKLQSLPPSVAVKINPDRIV